LLTAVVSGGNGGVGDIITYTFAVTEFGYYFTIAM
jgi:hypothetical protein